MILVLGGTREARVVSEMLGSTPHVVSLAGATRHPRPAGGTLRVGGFGGPAGLGAYLADEGIRAVIDATHPFATRMSGNAVAACRATGVPLLQILRPPWEIAPDWECVDDFDAAAVALASGSRAFLATGRGALGAFATRHDVHFIVRVIDAEPGRFPLSAGRFLSGRPPFTVEDEVATLTEHRVDTLVLRNSGGAGGTEKLRAAERLGLRILVVARPDMPDVSPEDRVQTPEAAFGAMTERGWLDA